MSAYHHKNQENCKFGIVFDCEDINDKKNLSHRSKTLSKEKGPQILKNVSNPVFKRTAIDFDEELLIIKQLVDEDNKEKCENASPAVEEKVKASTNSEKKTKIKGKETKSKWKSWH